MLHNFGSAKPEQMERDLQIHFAYNSWKSEGQWHSVSPSWLGLVDNDAFSLSGVFFSNLGSWSTMKYLPMGMVENKKLGVTWFWQIEHCGSWRWEFSNTAERPFTSMSAGLTKYITRLGRFSIRKKHTKPSLLLWGVFREVLSMASPLSLATAGGYAFGRTRLIEFVTSSLMIT